MAALVLFFFSFLVVAGGAVIVVSLLEVSVSTLPLALIVAVDGTTDSIVGVFFWPGTYTLAPLRSGARTPRPPPVEARGASLDTNVGKTKFTKF